MPSITPDTIGDILTANDRGDELQKEILALTHSLQISELPDMENLYFGLGTTRGHNRTPYWSYTDTVENLFSPDDEGETPLFRLFYRPTSGIPSRWIQHSNYVAIRFESDWNPEYNRDGDYDTVIPSREAVPSSDRVEKKFMIGGPLSDPIVTRNAEVAAEAIPAQLSRVKAGTRLNHVIEVLSANASMFGFERDQDRLSLPDVEDLPVDFFSDEVDTSSPLRAISGIGRRTIERFGSRFGVYTNLIDTDRSDFGGVLPGYSHSPNLDNVDTLIRAITEHYRTLCEDPDWSGPTIDPNQFREYPIGNPNYDGEI